MLKAFFSPASFLAGSLLLVFTSCESDEPSLPSARFRLKSVETNGPSWTLKEEYNYTSSGELAAIEWVRHTPFETSGSEQYIYDESGKLERVIKKTLGLVDEEVRYQYDGSRIIVASSYVNDKKISYQFYDYNTEGKLSLVEFYSYNLAANGFDRQGENHYNYYPDGNIHEVKKYDFIPEEASLILNHTKIYTEYQEEASVVDMELVIPGVVMQSNLPAKLEFQYPTSTYPYSFEYEFRSDGLTSKRTTTYNDGSTESTIFQYEEVTPF
ncbi:MAG: hypothetical protein R2820_05670 [Cyclobacteriaceae bacterium]|nr:hypothetical protein [Cyclobacteriaceae bacterium]